MDSEGDRVGGLLANEIQRAAQGQAHLVRVMTLESSTAGVALAQIEATLRVTLGEGGMTAIYGDTALLLLQKFRSMDLDHDGFLPGFDLGQALLQSGIQIDPQESFRYLQGAEVPAKGVQYYRFLELLLDGRQEPRSSFPPRSEQLRAQGSEPVTVTLTALVDEESEMNLHASSGGMGAGAGVGVGVGVGVGGANAGATGAVTTVVDEQFRQKLRSGFDIGMHMRGKRSISRVMRRMQGGADLSRLVWKKTGLMGMVGGSGSFPLKNVTSVEAVEESSSLQGIFLWEDAKCGCYFVLKASGAGASDITLSLEAATTAERNMFVEGFKNLCLRGAGVQDGRIATVSAGVGGPLKHTQEMQNAFKVFDADGSGMINKFELGQALRHLGQHHSEAEVSDMMARADLNGDGEIDYNEFVSLMMSKDDSSAMLQAFRVFDKDGDGYITMYELGQTLANLGERLSQEELQQMIGKVDKNGDSRLDFHEFCILMKMHQQAGGF